MTSVPNVFCVCMYVDNISGRMYSRQIFVKITKNEQMSMVWLVLSHHYYNYIQKYQYLAHVLITHFAPSMTSDSSF